MNQHPDFATLLNIHLGRADDRSAAWLARRLQVHPSTVTKWLNGDSRPGSPEKVIRIADLLGVYDSVERQQLILTAGFGYWLPNPPSVDPQTARRGQDNIAAKSTNAEHDEGASVSAVEKLESSAWKKWVKGVVRFIGR